MYAFTVFLFFLCVCVCACVHDGVPGNELIGHMSAQMSSLFNKADDLNCHYCQHLTMVLPTRWYLVIYHSDELFQITHYMIKPSEIGKCFGFQLDYLEVLFRFDFPLESSLSYVIVIVPSLICFKQVQIALCEAYSLYNYVIVHFKPFTLCYNHNSKLDQNFV